MTETPVPSASINTEITYLIPSSKINRRFWAPGEEYNTGSYAPYPVTIHNARMVAEPITMDTHGFCLSTHRSAITDWEANYRPDSAYAQELIAATKALTGADLVVPMGGMIRTSGQTSATTQPPAAEAHVDFTTRSAHMVAERMYAVGAADRLAAGKGYSRFICFSLWRPLSPAPQDWPLALCDGRSVRDDEGTANTKVDVDVIPTGDALFAPIEGEENMAAATIFNHSPDHKWYYFPDMTDEEIIFIKFHDSDHSRTWRAPHTSFHDKGRVGAHIRRSIEFRGVAYFD